ncbi:hypothetical protein NE237_017571 [Protea cynaroides]|uniref:non-specific serine/threonine protein kinase n=1 Tax=Protea cynaroides TaxID=273540 RepID=A0A9Q0K8B6_9MAGN|nr:hypothetical protein NE237_017571 [Protea cynaroides]
MVLIQSMELQKLLYYLTIFSVAIFAGKVTPVVLDGGTKDAQQLLSFKNTISNSGVLQNWQPNQNVCNFTGVTCNNSRVTALDLSSLPLSSDFQFVSSFLMSLERLESLTLKNASVSGNLTSASASRCSGLLSKLDLSVNHLSGSVSDVSSLSSCSGLESLNLSSNFLIFSVGSGDSGGLRLSFQALDLSYNKLSGQNVVPWLLAGGCNELKYFSVKANKISGNNSVASCRSLEYLDLSSNNFTGEVPSYGGCSSLQYLDLSGNNFYGDIGVPISSCQQLSFLNISSNQFSGNIPSFPSGSLLSLLLSNNNFQGEISLQLADACSTLLELDLSSNHMYGAVPSNLGACSSLESINLSNNNFSGEFPIETLVQMTSLKKLVLSYNNFEGSLPDLLSKLTNLELLDLSSNSISGSIPPGLCQDTKNSLQELYLQNNLLTGTIPPTISNCSHLVSLDLSFNYLTGRIPSSLGSLSQLKDLIMWLNQFQGEIPQELMYVQTLENLILDNNELTGTIPAGLSNCTNLNWISLSSNLLSGEIPAWIGRLSNLAILKLGNNSFSGSIPLEIGDCQSLIWLDLNSNHLTGIIPPTISKQSGKIAVGLITGKRYVYLKNDGSINCHGAGNLLEYAGIRQDGLNRVPTRHQCNFTRVYMGNTAYTFNNNGSMIFLDLSYNMLEGSIPKELGNMYYLMILNLGHNNLTGPIPPEMGSLKNVGVLDLSYNKFDGPIPNSFSGLGLLSELDLSNNNLSGEIPDSGQLGTFPASRYANNSGLCGYPLPNACGGDPSASNLQHQKSRRSQTSLAESVAMGLLFALFCIFGLIIVAVESRKRRKKKDAAMDVYIDSQTQSGTANVSWKLTGVREALSINLSTFEKPLWNLTFADLLEATNGFHNDSLVGSGGFGDVYKAELKDGTVVAIKKLIHVSGQGDREFTAEMETIGTIKHRNLVPLLGYCKVGEERLLVYEYMRFGSLEDVIHDRRKAGIKLNWAARRKIAIGAARGLAFLHHNCSPHIIHRDMKSSNVLLDDNLEARVSDFGMARLMSAMDTHLSVSTLAGTPGYVPPEYYQSFRCSTKGDVYSYGVVLLELLTGKQPTDSVDFGDNNLVGWVKQHAKLRISDVFDPELVKEDPSLEIELLQHLRVACACLDDRPWRRPTMIQVMAMFKEIQAGSGIDSSSTEPTKDGSFAAVEMSIKEAAEQPCKQ